MAYGEARAWWADVQHLHDDYERTAEARRRADETDDAPHTATVVLSRPAAAIPSRRTVEIRGRTVPAPPVATARALDSDRRGPQRLSGQRVVARPDRIAMWALLMGIVLILVAVGTADAATVVGAVVGH